jgi:hypothetical protein
MGMEKPWTQSKMDSEKIMRLCQRVEDTPTKEATSSSQSLSEDLTMEKREEGGEETCEDHHDDLEQICSEQDVTVADSDEEVETPVRTGIWWFQKKKQLHARRQIDHRRIKRVENAQTRPEKVRLVNEAAVEKKGLTDW